MYINFSYVYVYPLVCSVYLGRPGDNLRSRSLDATHFSFEKVYHCFWVHDVA